LLASTGGGGEKFRCQETWLGSGIPNTEKTTVCDGHVARTLSWDAGKPGAIFIDAREFQSPVSVPQLCLFEFYAGPIDRWLPLPQLLNQGRLLGKARQLTVNGRQVVKIEFELAEKKGAQVFPQPVKRFEISLDVAANYLVTELVGNYPDRQSRETYQVEEFKEVQPGVFFPVKISHLIERDGTPTQRMQVIVSDVKVNVAMDSERFEFRCPPGTRVTDRVSMSVYEADEKGLPTNQPEPLRTVTPGPGRPGPVQSEVRSEQAPGGIAVFRRGA
jgi:hypothetical protein